MLTEVNDTININEYYWDAHDFIYVGGKLVYDNDAFAAGKEYEKIINDIYNAYKDKPAPRLRAASFDMWTDFPPESFAAEADLLAWLTDQGCVQDGCRWVEPENVETTQ